MSEDLIPFQSFPDIQDHQEVLKATSLQINKDAGEEWINTSHELSPESIYQAVREQINIMCDCNVPGLVRLFYRVDLPEQTVRQVIERDDPGSVVDQLTYLLVRREALKVFYRMSYSA
ncbi:hypothetical protein [Sanyastnella coralliicola]|uniref:hypothetical protein n=1 Tax=Sanyastnella coralliicola TaxID=3069118 RepID=UPI0027BAD377|nr:hypothetical protein [Longitalea sp. SCSIO 12813]